MIDPSRVRGKTVPAAILLGAAIAFTPAAAIAAASKTSSSLACLSEGTGDEMTIATTPLPVGFTRLTGKVRRPLLRNGPWLLRIVLANDAGPPSHVAGLLSGPMPAPSGSAPVRGYPLSLYASADDGKFRHEERGWLIVADEFAMSLSIEQPGRLDARLDWSSSSGPRGHALSVPIARDDLKHLTIACFNGDFELYDLKVTVR